MIHTEESIVVSALAPPQVATAYCRRLVRGGAEDISVEQYQALSADPNRWDLLLDMTLRGARGSCRMGRRTPDGLWVTDHLRQAEAALLIELIERSPRAVRVADLATGCREARKLVERARRKIDERLGRYAWRSIHTVVSDQAVAFCFAPPSDLRWVAFRPIP